MSRPRIKRILVAIGADATPRSLLSQASFLAGMDGGRVTIVQVIQDVPDKPVMGLEPAQLTKLVGDHYQAKLEEAIETLTQQGVRADTKLAIGSPFMEIVREAVRGHYDIVVKQAEGQAKRDRIPFGSTDMQLLRMCPHPLWIMKSGRVRRIRNIMVAIDPVPEDAEKNALAAKLLSWGALVAEAAQATLHVFHAWRLAGETTLRGRALLSEQVDRLVMETKRTQRALVDEAVRQLALDAGRLHVHFQAGVAARLIPAAVAAKEIDLLVMGTIGRTGIPGFFIGNTAETVLQKVDCSVLAIKPDGFRTVIEPRAA